VGESSPNARPRPAKTVFRKVDPSCVARSGNRVEVTISETELWSRPAPGLNAEYITEPAPSAPTNSSASSSVSGRPCSNRTERT
jgi:hypothetical protein